VNKSDLMWKERFCIDEDENAKRPTLSRENAKLLPTTEIAGLSRENY